MSLLEPTPQQKQMFTIMNSGAGFVNPLQAGSSDLDSNLKGVPAQGTTLTGHLADVTYGPILTGAGLTTALITSMNTSASTGLGGVSTLTTYGNKAVDEFSQRMRIADQYTNISKRFTGVDPACSAHSGVMGVVKDIGQTAMDAYNTVMDTMSSAITALDDAITKGLDTVAALATQAVTAINAGIAQATAFVNKITTAIADEVSELARQAQASTFAWLSGVLPDWFGDTCKGDITDKVSSPALKAAAS
ncbi:hypothetical protein [Yersinia phage vB_YenM_P778]